MACLPTYNNTRFKSLEDLFYSIDKTTLSKEDLDYLINKYDWNKNINTEVNNSKVEGFQGYKGNFEDKGKGTSQGDGKDKAMREVADGFVVELSKATPSSSLTSLKTGSIIEQMGSKEQTSARSTKNLADEGTIIMLARNGSLKGKPLSKNTKNMIKFYHTDFNMEFVVGDMPGVDSQFIDYLQEIGANFTIYHTGNKSRIKIQNINNQSIENEFTPEDLGLNTDSNQNDAVCK